jgi:endo-alpha-1,4-polygalactosaminidase (GH114 family)
MMDRRTFALGLGTLGLGASLPLAEARASNRYKQFKGLKPKNIPYTPIDQIPNHRQLMRDIVIALSTYAKSSHPQFVILARNAPELLLKEQREWDWETGRDYEGAAAGKYSPVGSVIGPYLQAIDAMLVDGLFCGMESIDQPTDPVDSKPLEDALTALRKEGRRMLSIEYAKDKKQASAAAKKANQAKTLTYIDEDGNKLLGRIPGGRPAMENAAHITSLDGAKNFLPMLRSTSFNGKDEWVAALAATNYDLLLIDPFWRGTTPLTTNDVHTLKLKELGSQRLVFANLSLGRALDTRFYWKKEWVVGSPNWLVASDPDQSSQTIVRYWDAAWKEIVGQYMQGLLTLGFDGVLFDDLDSYLYFEEMTPLQ